MNEKAATCIGLDPLCPCQDGDVCHYKDAPNGTVGLALQAGKRGGAGRGQGRKPLAKTGELMKSRPVRMTDAEWEDFKLVTPEKVRQWVVKQAAKLRKAEET